jgi:hypothetical protein
MKIHIELEMPEPGNSGPPKVDPLTPEERVRDALDEILSGRESKREWSFVNRVYKQLKCQKDPSEKAKNLIEMIEPVLSKFGYHGVSAD